MDLTELAATLGAAATVTPGKMSIVVRRTALLAERRMKAEVPVRFGHLRDSVSTTVTGGGRWGTIRAEVGPTINYAKFVAFGTRKQAPNPFDLRTMEAIGPVFEQAVAAIGGELTL